MKSVFLKPPMPKTIMSLNDNRSLNFSTRPLTRRRAMQPQCDFYFEQISSDLAQYSHIYILTENIEEKQSGYFKFGAHLFSGWEIPQIFFN